MNEASLKIKVIINQLVITHGGSVPLRTPLDSRWISPRSQFFILSATKDLIVAGMKMAGFMTHDTCRKINIAGT